MIVELNYSHVIPPPRKGVFVGFTTCEGNAVPLDLEWFDETEDTEAGFYDDTGGHYKEKDIFAWMDMPEPPKLVEVSDITEALRASIIGAPSGMGIEEIDDLLWRISRMARALHKEGEE